MTPLMLTEKMADVMVLMPMALSTMVTQYALYYLSDLRPFRPDFLANSYLIRTILAPPSQKLMRLVWPLNGTSCIYSRVSSDLKSIL